MRRPMAALALTALALALGGCSAEEDEAAVEPPSPTVPSAPATTEPAPSPTPTPTWAAPTDIPAEAMLPATALGPLDGPRYEQEGIVVWQVPQRCHGLSPTGAVAMRTVDQGTGELEEPIGVQQVAVFTDADAATAAADELVAGLTRCTTQAGSDSTTYVLEDVAVGAQGHGLATDYYGASAEGRLDDSIGSYLAMTRRGNALTLVSAEGGESIVSAARELVTGQTQAAWELLCRYDSAGC